MRIEDLFEKSINRNIRGVVTIGNEEEEQRKQELEEYVVTRELVKHFRTFFKSYKSSITSNTADIGMWITGFFGSGKSHFLKIIAYLLENRIVDGKSSIEYFENKISDEIIKGDIKTCASVSNTVVLFNIDSKSKSQSKLNKSAIMEVMLRTFNEKIGLCSQIPWVADFERLLISEGIYEKFSETFELNSNKTWIEGRNTSLFERDAILKSLVEVRGMTQETAKKYFDDMQTNFYMDTETFAKLINDYCQTNNTHVVFLMDEVGQFIGEHSDLMLNLQTVVEDLGKLCSGKAWVVITSQQGLDDIIDDSKYKKMDFSKIQGRFKTRMLLSGSNADEVIKKRILEKSKNAVTPLKSIYETEKSKISQLILFQSSPKWNGYKDAEEFKDVYPFVPYQFELLQKVFEAIREHGLSEGKHLSQSERSLLSAFQESAQKFQNSNIGILVPFNSFYVTIEQFIDYNIKQVFSSARNNAFINDFDFEVLKVLFMIKHVKEMKATLDRLATLMVSDMKEDKLQLKNKISESLRKLENETLVQKNGEIYDFLTDEEQDINRQINRISVNEGDIIRKISDAAYEQILGENKIRYNNRYTFGLNRYVDYDLRGNENSDYINVKIVTNYSNFKDDSELSMESARSNLIVIDLRKGTFIDELIKVAKIETYERNNSVGKGVSFADILSKKRHEAVERRTRAEELINQELRNSTIYFNGGPISIKVKDAKDRLIEAIEFAIKNTYYKLEYISVFTSDNTAVRTFLDGKDSGGMLNAVAESNQRAFNEITEYIKNSKSIQRRVTVKSLIVNFQKQPYGWKDFDIRAIIAKLWFEGTISILIHNTQVAKNNANFKMDFTRRDHEDAMVLALQEKIDDKILDSVRRIMKNSFNQNFDINEETLREDSLNYFRKKKECLHDIDVKNGSDYPGEKSVKLIKGIFEKLSNIGDSLSLFEEIIGLSNELASYGEILDKIEAFYNLNSPQMKNYKDSILLIKWYQDNQLIDGVQQLGEVVEEINEIISLESPFEKMHELSSLSFKGNQLKDSIIKNKIEKIINSLKDDLSLIDKEFSEVTKQDLSEVDLNVISEMFNELQDLYLSWTDTINADTPNVDIYLTTSSSNVRKFRENIKRIITSMNPEDSKDRKGKKVNLSQSISIANRKINSDSDIEKVLSEIRKVLQKALSESDYVEVE